MFWDGVNFRTQMFFLRIKLKENIKLTEKNSFILD